MLENINYPSDLNNKTYEQKKELAKEIRQLIIQTVSKTGGHLASNLGVVELTIALCSIFNFPEDKIVWDVGHQTYVYKILTGRKEQMDTLRQKNGIAGFPKTAESKYDCFNTGHSSTSISVALGLAKARDLKQEQNNIISVIGDGALTGGMALEALNDAGSSKTKLVVILNDNEMSISKNVGGMTTLLSKLRTKKFYTKTNIRIKTILNKVPIVGKPTVKFAQKIKRGIKQLLIPKMFFEDIGFTYLGPVDGHDIEKLESILKTSKNIDNSVLIHVITKKGKGYLPAEEKPDKFHSTGSFNIETGEKIKTFDKDYSKVFGDKLIALAKEDNKIVAITAAMKEGTGLEEFANKFSDRFFDVGIAEQHALGFVAGLAKAGLKPVIPIYSSFLQRGYDQIIHDVCLQKLPVIICVDRAGIVGNDGETHQGILDLSFLNTIPNLTIMAPSDFEELENMLTYAFTLNSPVAIRYPRGKQEKILYEYNKTIEMGKADVVKKGTDITIIAIGKMVSRAIQVANKLEEDNTSVEVINARFLKPIDKQTIMQSVIKTKKIVTIEDNIIIGGLGDVVLNILYKENIECSLLKLGYPDEFIRTRNSNSNRS